MHPWILGLIGGILIGLSAALMMFGRGRILGVSGMMGSLFSRGDNRMPSLLFLTVILLTGLLVHQIRPEFFQSADTGRNLIHLFAAGVLVGAGTRLGSGCTSGHGICGLARFSPRSIAAVLTFMASGMITATLVRMFIMQGV